MDHLVRALWYARRGYPVLPLHAIDLGEGVCGCGRAICRCTGRCQRHDHCTSPGKHPVSDYVPHGLLDATIDEAIITQWWALYPEANVGIVTGEASGLLVLDADLKNGGPDTLANLEKRFGDLPDTWVVHTGGGGLHVWFRMPGVAVRNSAGALGPGLDVRAIGGYVVAAPSLHASGNRYLWDDELRPGKAELAEVPMWLLERMAPKADLTEAAVLPERIPDGMRNNMLASLAGTLRRRGVSEAGIAACLLVENQLRCDPPMADREVRAIARSISRPEYEPVRVRFRGGYGVPA